MEQANAVTTKRSENSPGRPNSTVSINPASGETLGIFKVNTVEDIFEAVKNAREAQPAWQAIPINEKVNYIKKLGKFIQQRSMDIAEAISKDNGKTISDAMITECGPAALATGYYCRRAKKLLKPKRTSTGSILTINKQSKIIQVPYGVVGIISPWNYPFSIPYSEVVMGLLAGNTIILKAASETQMVGHILKECMESAGLPPHVFNYVNIPGRIAGDAFIDAGVDKLFFTGSVPVGKYLMKKASERLTPLVLELGGNDPMIVCEDADLYRATSGAVWAGLQNAGQSCGAVERIYVQQTIYQDFIDQLKVKVESLRVGNGQSTMMDIGAMTTERQMETVQNHIKDALDLGATLWAQSHCPEESQGNFLPCTVLTDVNHTMLVMKEETFGPVLAVMPYDTVEEAIHLANDSNVGLNGSVWSKDHKKAKDIAGKLMVGAVMINDHLTSHGLAETPWGGIKESGIGRTHGDIGFSEMIRPLCVVDDILPFARRSFWWQPYDNIQFDGMKGIIDVLWGNGPVLRFAGFVRMSRAFFRSFIKR